MEARHYGALFLFYARIKPGHIEMGDELNRRYENHIVFHNAWRGRVFISSCFAAFVAAELSALIVVESFPHAYRQRKEKEGVNYAFHISGH